MAETVHDPRFDAQAGLYVLGAQTRAEREAFEVHLRACEACAAEVRRLGPVAGALAQAVPQVDPPLALRHRVLSSVGALPAAARPARTETDGRTGQGNWAWLAIAASLALAVAASGYAWRLNDRLTARISVLERGLDEANARAAAGEQRLVEVRNTMASAQTAVTILTAADMQRVDLAGQPAAPAASARAYLSGSRGVLFTAASLPVLPAGKVYQLWVVSTTKVAVSVGLLTPDGTGSVTQTFGPPPATDPTAVVAVTDEPAGGVPQPTGQFQVVGAVTGI